MDPFVAVLNQPLLHVRLAVLPVDMTVRDAPESVDVPVLPVESADFESELAGRLQRSQYLWQPSRS